MKHTRDTYPGHPPGTVPGMRKCMTVVVKWRWRRRQVEVIFLGFANLIPLVGVELLKSRTGGRRGAGLSSANSNPSGSRYISAHVKVYGT